MAIPAHLLWNVQTNVRQKFGILALFSLTVVTMVLSIVRVEVALRDNREDDTWFYICTTIEMTIGKPLSSLLFKSYLSMFVFFLFSDPRSLPGLLSLPLHARPQVRLLQETIQSNPFTREPHHPHSAIYRN